MEIEHCEFPDDFYYDVGNDVWLGVSDDGMSATMGVTSVLSFLAGKLFSVKLRTELNEVKPQQTIATVESGKYFRPVRSPITGRISEFDLTLLNNPRLVNDSPYDSGWIAKFDQIDWQGLKRLEKGEAAKDALSSRIRELKVRCFKALPDDEMISIGTECSTTLANLDELLSKTPVGTVVHLVSDDPTSDIEMIRWSDQTKNKVLESRKEANLFHFIVRKTVPSA